MDRIAILGASRGLGWALYKEWSRKSSENVFFLSSRKITARETDVMATTVLSPHDFSKVPIDPAYIHRLQEFAPTILIYMAGGGPFGLFEEKKWSDHQWAIQTSFLFPAELLHQILSAPMSWPSLQQVVCVGSSVAEDKPDPQASSYAAAKHALKGLVTTIQSERPIDKAPQIKLYSPGYMQTDMLPESSWPRQQGLAEPVDQAAKKLIEFIEKNNQR